jgi:hypothetical protein
MDIKQIKENLRQQLGSDYEVIIKQKSTKKIREKTQNEIKEIQDLILERKIDLSDKGVKITFLRHLYFEGYSPVALAKAFGFKSHTNVLYYCKNK